jgi:hypothetical protein
MIRRLDDYIVHPRTFYASMSAADRPGRQGVDGQGGELVGHNSHLPSLAFSSRNTQLLGWSQVLIPRAEGIRNVMRVVGLSLLAPPQLVWALGAVGSHGHPFFG